MDNGSTVVNLINFLSDYQGGYGGGGWDQSSWYDYSGSWDGYTGYGGGYGGGYGQAPAPAPAPAGRGGRGGGRGGGQRFAPYKR